jgi:hypothetical protein
VQPGPPHLSGEQSISKDTNLQDVPCRGPRDHVCPSVGGGTAEGGAELPWKPSLFLFLSLRLLPPTEISASSDSSPLGPSRARLRLFL